MNRSLSGEQRKNLKGIDSPAKNALSEGGQPTESAFFYVSQSSEKDFFTQLVPTKRFEDVCFNGCFAGNVFAGDQSLVPNMRRDHLEKIPHIFFFEQ